jgi:hypothetical protein
LPSIPRTNAYRRRETGARHSKYFWTLDTKKDNDRLNKSIEQLKQLDVRQEQKRQVK